MSFDVYYHDSATDWTAPTVGSMSSTFQAGQASISVHAADETGIQTVVVAYTNGTGIWESIELSASGSAWTGNFPANADSRFFIQVVDKAGNVAMGDNDGRYFTPGQGWHSVYMPLVIKHSR
jgi:hypothetical protein